MSIMTEVRPLVSIITIVNKEPIYNGFKDSLREQLGVNYELIKIKNDNGQFVSARLAFNQVAKKATGKYLLFVHPDIRFLNEGSLSNIISYCESLKSFGVVGVAGCPGYGSKSVKSVVATNIVQGKQKQPAGQVRVDHPISVQTVDECLFIMKKDVWERIPFSDLKGWHFYAVEQCLRAGKIGLKNYVIPADIWHLSPGTSEDYHYALMGYTMMKLYGKDYPTIYTTIRKWSWTGVSNKVNFLLFLVKRLITTGLNIRK